MLTRVGDLATKGVEKDDVLNAFFFLLVRFALRLLRSLGELAQSGAVRQGRQEKIELKRTYVSETNTGQWDLVGCTQGS